MTTGPDRAMAAAWVAARRLADPVPGVLTALAQAAVLERLAGRPDMLAASPFASLARQPATHGQVRSARQSRPWPEPGDPVPAADRQFPVVSGLPGVPPVSGGPVPVTGGESSAAEVPAPGGVVPVPGGESSAAGVPAPGGVIPPARGESSAGGPPVVLAGPGRPGRRSAPVSVTPVSAGEAAVAGAGVPPVRGPLPSGLGDLLAELTGTAERRRRAAAEWQRAAGAPDRYGVPGPGRNGATRVEPPTSASWPAGATATPEVASAGPPASPADEPLDSPSAGSTGEDSPGPVSPRPGSGVRNGSPPAPPEPWSWEPAAPWAAGQFPAGPGASTTAIRQPAVTAALAPDGADGSRPGDVTALDGSAGPAAAPPTGPVLDALPWDASGAGVAGLDGDELAALVNDALIEQARRHGWEF